MLIAALCAEGPRRSATSGQIDSGYERIDERLRALGAQIERVVAPTALSSGRCTLDRDDREAPEAGVTSGRGEGLSRYRACRCSTTS